MPSNRQSRAIVAAAPPPESVRVITTARHHDQSGNRRRLDDTYIVTMIRARELEALGYARILGPGPTQEKRAPGKAQAPTGGAAPSPSLPPAPVSPPQTATTSTPVLSAGDAQALEHLRRAAETTAKPRGGSSPSKTPSR
jgi:hypothetical protein